MDPIIYSNPRTKSALADLLSLSHEQVYLLPAWLLASPPGLDWADYEPQPDLEEPVEGEDEDGNPLPPRLIPQPDLRVPRDPWTWYQAEYPTLANRAQPSAEEVDSWTPAPLPQPEAPPDPLTDVDIAKSYAQAYQAAQDIIFLLMSRVSTALVVGKHFTPETVNKEGTRFTRYHKDEIEAFKLAGRHPDAGDALYTAVEASAGEFLWLKKEDNILGIFATTLPRNPK